MGLKPGEAMDLLTGWDFTLPRHRCAALKYIRVVKPRLLIGSPECTFFSALQNLTRSSWTKERDAKLMEAKEHIRFVVQLYEEQVKKRTLVLA